MFFLMELFKRGILTPMLACLQLRYLDYINDTYVSVYVTSYDNF